MKKTILILNVLLALCSANLLQADDSFSAICTLATQHNYHLAKKPDFHPASNPERMIDEWNIDQEYSTSITVNYTQGDDFLQITDSRQTEPLKAYIIFYNGNTIYAIHLAKGSNDGAQGATTRTYAINKLAETLLTTTMKSSSFLAPRVEASAEGNPDCIFK